jgi:hypothetical protein
MSFLEISGTDLSSRNMRRDREDRSIAAMSIEKSINQVEVAGAATARTDREFAAKLSLGTGCKRGGFFVAHVDPLNPSIFAQRVADRIQAVAHYAVNPFDTRL